MISSELQKEALKYDLQSLINLQQKRQQNIIIFEQSIKNEREASMKEASAQAALEDKLRLFDAKMIKLSEADYKSIKQDLPKLKSTQENRRKNIDLLRTAIIEEQESIDREAQMIFFLQSKNPIIKN